MIKLSVVEMSGSFGGGGGDLRKRYTLNDIQIFPAKIAVAIVYGGL